LKNQYFGDNRDLLKFDLVFQIVKEGLADRFTYIPMLTADGAEAPEPEIRRCESSGGVKNAVLVDFLDKAIINEKRNVGQLEEFFADNGIDAHIYTKDVFFTHEARKSYFSGIHGDWLAKSLILVDPDRGLEEDQNGAGNLLYSELASLYERMDDDSYLMFTQRFPYDLYEAYLGMRTAELKDRIPGSRPVSIDDLDTIIFFLTKNKYLQGCLLNLLKDYTQQYAKKE
jgi:hypothetical protein